MGTVVNPQDPNTFCFTIDGSTALMKDFVGYNLLKSVNLTSTADLDVYLAMRMDMAQFYVQAFQQQMGCPGFTGRGERFHMTYYQAMLLVLSQNQPLPAPSCPPPTTVPNRLPCRSSCLQSLATISNIFNNPMLCPPGMDTIGNRQTTLLQYQAICDQLDGGPKAPTGNTASVPPCLPFVQAEATQCGFPVFADAQVYCGMAQPNDVATGFITPNTTDPCCTTLVQFTPAPLSGNSNNSGKILGLGRTLFIEIAAGAGGGLLLLIILIIVIVCCCRRKKTKTPAYVAPANLGRDGSKGKNRRRSSVDEPLRGGSSGNGSSQNSGRDAKGVYQPVSGLGLGAGGASSSSAVGSGAGGAGYYASTFPTMASGGSGGENGRRQSSLPGRNNSDYSDRRSSQTSLRMRAVYDYTAGMDDELSFRVGQTITVTAVFDDGWGHGILENGIRGAFPLSCVVPADKDTSTLL